jgi:hypothetical protein
MENMLPNTRSWHLLLLTLVKPWVSSHGSRRPQLKVPHIPALSPVGTWGKKGKNEAISCRVHLLAFVGLDLVLTGESGLREGIVTKPFPRSTPARGLPSRLARGHRWAARGCDFWC